MHAADDRLTGMEPAPPQSAANHPPCPPPSHSTAAAATTAAEKARFQLATRAVPHSRFSRSSGSFPLASATWLKARPPPPPQVPPTSLTAPSPPRSSGSRSGAVGIRAHLRSPSPPHSLSYARDAVARSRACAWFCPPHLRNCRRHRRRCRHRALCAFAPPPPPIYTGLPSLCHPPPSSIATPPSSGPHAASPLTKVSCPPP